MWWERSIKIAQELLAQSRLEKWDRLRPESTSSCSTLYTTTVIHGRFSCHCSSPLLYYLYFCKAYKTIYWQVGYLGTITRDVDCGRVFNLRTSIGYSLQNTAGNHFFLGIRNRALRNTWLNTIQLLADLNSIEVYSMLCKHLRFPIYARWRNKAWGAAE